MRFTLILFVVLAFSCKTSETFSSNELIYGSLVSYKSLELNEDGTFNELIYTPIDHSEITYLDRINGNYYKNGDTLVLTITEVFDEKKNDIALPRLLVLEKYLVFGDSLQEIFFTNEDSVGEGERFTIPEILVKGKSKKIEKAIHEK